MRNAFTWGFSPAGKFSSRISQNEKKLSERRAVFVTDHNVFLKLKRRNAYEKKKFPEDEVCPDAGGTLSYVRVRAGGYESGKGCLFKTRRESVL